MLLLRIFPYRFRMTCARCLQLHHLGVHQVKGLHIISASFTAKGLAVHVRQPSRLHYRHIRQLATGVFNTW